MKKLILLAVLASSVFANEGAVKINFDKSNDITTRVEALYVATNSLCKEISSGHIMPRIGHKTLNKVTEVTGNIQVEQRLDTFCKYKLDSVVLTFRHKGKLAYNATYIANYTDRRESQTSEIDCSYENESKLVCYSNGPVGFDHDNTAEIRVNLN